MPKTRHDTAYTAFALRKKSNAHAVSPDKYMHRQTNKCIEPQKTNKVDQTNKETMPRKEISLHTNKMHKVDDKQINAYAVPLHSDQTNKETMPRKEISLQTNKMHKVVSNMIHA